MNAYELLPLLTHLTLTVENDWEDWEDRLVFIGTPEQWRLAEAMELKLINK